jgi:glycine cleavage system protein P-like pyridoxal-binding family
MVLAGDARGEPKSADGAAEITQAYIRMVGAAGLWAASPTGVALAIYIARRLDEY